MLRLKSIHFKELGAIVFFFLLIQYQSFSQCQCPVGYTEIMVPAGQTVSTTGGFRQCYNIGANATLEINSYAGFKECRFIRDSDSRIVITSTGAANFSTNAGSGQNEIISCGPNNLTLPIAGLNVFGTVAIYDLHMDLGPWGYSIGIDAGLNSSVWAYNGLSIRNAFDQGIRCVDCFILNLVNTQISPDCITGISVFGSPTGTPSVLIFNSGIYAQNSALFGLFFNTTSSIFRLENSTFSSGIGSVHNNVPTISVNSFAVTPQPFLGNLNYIQDCTIEMNAVGRGIEANKVNRFRIEGNEVNIRQNVAAGVFNSGIDLTDMPNVRITDNTVSFSGDNQFNQFSGLNLTGSVNSFIRGNTFNGVRTGVRILGDCSDADPNVNNFVANVFSGAQETGLLVGPGSMLGQQDCHDNRWEGAFNNLGYENQGDPLLSLFTANINSIGVYQPTNDGGIMPFDGCEILTEFTGGGGSFYISNNDQTNSAASIFPNPTQNSFSITLPELDNDKGFIVELTDLMGKSIFKQKIDTGVYQTKFDASQLGAGVYLVHILSGVYRQTEKLIVTD